MSLDCAARSSSSFRFEPSALGDASVKVMPSSSRAFSIPRAAESLNDWSPRPPMSYTRPTFGPLPAGAALPAAAVVPPAAVVPAGAVVPPGALVAAGALVPAGAPVDDELLLSLPHAAATRPSMAMAASDVNRLVLRIFVSPLEVY